MPDYLWRPIEPLSEEERRVDLAGMGPLYASWRAARLRMQHGSEAQLAQFSQRLVRRLSIETGILERLYDVDRVTTEALVAYGFAEDLVTRSSTTLKPWLLIEILRDQEAAMHLVIDCVESKRELTKELIDELQALLTRHQETATAVDQFGNRKEIPLLRGKFKQEPDDPRRPDNSIHEYCPPNHVDSEMNNLLEWFSTYSDVDPVIVAAWIHHRFTQIHPYQDANGRVARALTTLVFLRAGLLPIVLERHLRGSYVNALEAADLGNLSGLIQLFAQLERDAILQGVSVDPNRGISQHRSTAEVIAAIAQKLSKRQVPDTGELRRVNSIALGLRARGQATLHKTFDEIGAKLGATRAAEAPVIAGGSDRGNAHWFRSEVIISAAGGERFANFTENHYFLEGSVRVQRERLIFVVSFHHIGRELTGIAEATAFARLQSLQDSENRNSSSDELTLSSAEPFVFTYQTEVDKVASAFDQWLDDALTIALKAFGDRL